MNCDDVVLETVCVWCDGEGTGSSRDGPDTPCDRCDGAGYEMTELGEKVFDLMRHQLGPILDALRLK